MNYTTALPIHFYQAAMRSCGHSFLVMVWARRDLCCKPFLTWLMGQVLCTIKKDHCLVAISDAQ